MKTVSLVLVILLICTSACTQSKKEDQSHSPPQARAEGQKSDFGGAVPLGIEDWFAEVSYPEIQYIPASGTVAFTVTLDGRADNCRVVSPADSGRFMKEEICLALENQARFEPARRKNGIPMETDATMILRFRP